MHLKCLFFTQMIPFTLKPLKKLLVGKALDTKMIRLVRSREPIRLHYHKSPLQRNMGASMLKMKSKMMLTKIKLNLSIVCRLRATLKSNMEPVVTRANLCKECMPRAKLLDEENQLHTLRQGSILTK